jgi:predicted nucleotidyltransferase component of viral defense system
MLHHESVTPTTYQLLKFICSLEELQDFSLAGGTALALQIGHRISVDLDFFGNRPFSSEEILDLLSSQRQVSIISQNKNILILNIQEVKVDFVNYRYPLISDQVTEKPVRLLGLPDIAAMKLAAIAGRGRKRDFFDLYFLLEKFSLRQMIDFYNQKYEDGSEMMVARSLTYFDDADTDELPRLLTSDVSWPDVKRKLLEETKELYT